MEEPKSTVTIPLEKYEEMKSKIHQLQIEVAEKTIIKYYLNPVLSYTISVLLVVAISCLLILFQN